MGSKHYWGITVADYTTLAFLQFPEFTGVFCIG